MEARVYKVASTTGETFPCRADESVLAAMRRAGAGPIRCGCFGGGCGVCRMRIASGTYAVCKPMSRAHVSTADEADGIALLCCICPTSDLSLENV